MILEKRYLQLDVWVLNYLNNYYHTFSTITACWHIILNILLAEGTISCIKTNQMQKKSFLNQFSLIAFACNAKSFAIAFLFSSFYFFFLSLFLDGLLKAFLRMFHDSLPRKLAVKIRFVTLDTIKKVSLNNIFQDFLCDACDPYYAMCFTLLTITSIHSIWKITKMRNL